MLRVSKAFFSYSRQDSEFTLKLAKDLRAMGAPLWLDQLDITPGHHWDTAVEKAIGVASSLVIVLSPDSIQSQNVMDEVSFALEEGKLVIPVLYRDCKIPLRLRRLQYIDLRTDYQTGLAEIRKMLEVERQSETAPGNTNEPLAHNSAPTMQDKASRPEAADARTTQESLPGDRAERRDREEIAPQPQPPQPIAPPQRPPVDAAKNLGRSRSKVRVVAGLAVAVVLIVVVLVWIGKEPSNHAPRSSQASPPAESDRSPDAGHGAQESDAKNHPANPAAPGEQHETTEPANTFNARQWVEKLLRASEGPSVDELLPFYDTTVSPYFRQPSAGWADIAKDKQAYFKHFPRIEYTLMEPPREFPQPDGSINIEYDLQYSNLRNDGVIVHGTSHAWASLRQIDGQWKITGISERVQ